MYIEDKSDGLLGPARIGRVTFSKTGKTLYYGGRAFQSLATPVLGSMDELCRRGANVNANPFRGTPLTYAAGYNKVESVRWLLNHGADPNLRHDFGGEGHGCNAVALHLAAQFGALETLRLLVEHGANLNTRDGQFDATPLQWAAHAGADNSITLLRELGAE